MGRKVAHKYVCTDEKTNLRLLYKCLPSSATMLTPVERSYTVGCLHNNDHYYVNIQEVSLHHDFVIKYFSRIFQLMIFLTFAIIMYVYMYMYLWNITVL